MVIIKTSIKSKSKTRDVVEIVGAVLAAFIFYQFLIFATGTPMPIVSVVSESMEPVLHKGDLLFVTADKYQIGDIVIYERSEISHTIVHRIIEEKDGGFIIKGDNNNSPDPGIVQKNQILGKVKFAFPLAGYPRLALFVFGI